MDLSQYTKKKKKKNDPIASLMSQIQNDQTRLDSAGQDTDTRNWFEKLTNLPEHQNWFLDTIDLLERPFQGISNVIDGALTHSGKGVGKEFKEGLSGKDKKVFSDILNDVGWKVNKNSPWYDKAAHGIVGFAGDVALDPLSYVGVGAVRNVLGKAAVPIVKGMSKGMAKGVGKAVETATKGESKTLTEALDKLNPDSFAGSAVKTARIGKDLFNSSFRGIHKDLDGNASKALTHANNAARHETNYQMKNLLDTLVQANKLADGRGVEVGRNMEADAIARRLQPTRQAIVDDMVERAQKKQVVRLPDGKISDDLSAVKDARGTQRKTIQQMESQRKTLLNEASQQKAALTRKMDNLVNKEATKLRKSAVGIGLTAEEIEKQAFQNAIPKGLDTLHQAVQQLDQNLSENLKSLDEALSPLKANQVELKSFKAPKEGETLSDFRNPMPSNLAPIPEDEGITQATKLQHGLNHDLEKMGTKADVDVKRTYGENYMTHALTDEMEKIRKKSLSKGVGKYLPNDKIFSGRKYQNMSAEEINQRVMKEAQTVLDKGTPEEKQAFLKKFGSLTQDMTEKEKEDFLSTLTTTKLFQENAFHANLIGGTRQVEHAMRTQMLHDLEKTNFVKKLDHENVPVRDGNVKVTVRNPDGSSSYYEMTKDAESSLNRFNQLFNDDNLNQLLHLFDKANTFFKSTALFSVGYHFRNTLGNMINSFIAGMNPADLGKYSSQAIHDLTRLPKLMDKKRLGEALTQDESKLVKEYDEFLQQGLRESSLNASEFSFGKKEQVARETLESKSKSLKQKAAEAVKTPGKTLIQSPKTLMKANLQAGMTVDELQRFAMFKWAKAKGMDAKKAADKVREALFDYGDLTTFESQVVKRMIPFYTWMRKNVPYQLKNLVKQPQKYVWMNDLINEAYESTGIDKNKVADYAKDQMYIPLFGDGKGNGQLLKANLPMADLAKLNTPNRMFLESLTPFLKVPLELGSNTNLFTGQKIKNFKGEKKSLGQIPFTKTDVNVPVQLQHVLSQIGALRNLGTRSTELANGDVTLGLTSKHDAQKATLSKLYQQLADLQGKMKLYEQNTKEAVPTINDLKKTKKKKNYSSFLGGK